MSIFRSGRKVVDAIDAALAIKNSKGKIPGSLEYPWYLVYDILLNSVVAGSSYIGISAQHVLFFKHNGQNYKRIPDFVVMYTNVARSPSGDRTGVNSTICVVVEVKPLTTPISDEEKRKGTEGNQISTFNVERQSLRQAQMALHLSPNQDNVIAVITIGQFWSFTMFKRIRTQIEEDGLPTLTPVARNKVSGRKRQNNLLALVRKGSDLSDETKGGCEELKAAIESIIGKETW